MWCYYPSHSISLLGLPYKISQTEWLKQWTLIFSQFWGLEVWDSGVGRIWLLLRPLSLTCRRPSSSLSSPPSVCVLISTYKDSSHKRLGPTHRTSVYLNCLFFQKFICWFIFGCAVSAAAQKSYSSFSVQDSLGCRARALGRAGLSSCGWRDLEHWLSSCVSGA